MSISLVIFNKHAPMVFAARATDWPLVTLSRFAHGRDYDPACLRVKDRAETHCARWRERDVVRPDGRTHAGRTPAHWRRVALLVAKMTGRRVGVDTATRMWLDADFSARDTNSRPAREPIRKAELQAMVRKAKNDR